MNKSFITKSILGGLIAVVVLQACNDKKDAVVTPPAIPINHFPRVLKRSLRHREQDGNS
ncbi:MAG: hypothetical protein ABI480_13520 [Chitinophagaceae bacterium]